MIIACYNSISVVSLTILMTGNHVKDKNAGTNRSHENFTTFPRCSCQKRWYFGLETVHVIL